MDAQLDGPDTNYPCTLLYHEVATNPHAFLSQYRINLSPGVFETHMRVIRERFAPIGLAELRDERQNGKSVRNRILITLDDGYKAAVEYGGDILSSLGLGSIWFINSSMCENRSVFWISKLIWAVDAGLIEELLRQANMRWPGLLAPMAKEDDMVLWAKEQYSRAFHKFIDEFTEAHGFVEEEQSQEARIFASMEELRGLADTGAVIGNHTRTHATMRNLALADCRSEVVECHRELQNGIGLGATCFAYPFGEPGLHWSPWMTEMIHDLGYEFVFSVETARRDVSSQFWRGAVPRYFVPSTLASATEFRHYVERALDGFEP